MLYAGQNPSREYTFELLPGERPGDVFTEDLRRSALKMMDGDRMPRAEASATVIQLAHLATLPKPSVQAQYFYDKIVGL